MKTGFGVLFAAASLAISAQASHSQAACADRNKIVDQLETKYKESHKASGLESDTKMVEIWTSEKSGTWTILITQADGQTCIAAAGRNWLDMPASVAQLGQAS